MKKICLILVILFLSLAWVDISHALPPTPTLDLTTLGAFGFINGARFDQLDIAHTGTGRLDPFVRMHANKTEQGYNTSGRKPGNKAPFDDNPNHLYTHDVLLSDLTSQIVYLPNENNETTAYYEFLLDTNQKNSKKGRFLSLDSLQIYLSNSPSLTTETLGDLGTLIYNLDASDNWIKLDDTLSSGSAVGDMIAYIPTDLFSDDYSYVYFYSQFGSNHNSNGGFEEWGFRSLTYNPPPPIPEPATLSLLGLGLVGLVGLRKKKA